MVLRISADRSASIIRQTAGIPCADTGHTDPIPVCFVFTHSLDLPFLPKVQFLSFLSWNLSLHFQVLKHDHIRMILMSIFCDRTGSLSGKFRIQTFRIRPSASDLLGTVFLLESPDPSEYMGQPVFFTGEIDKFPVQDSSVWPHDTTDCIRIDSKIHTADELILYRCFW